MAIGMEIVRLNLADIIHQPLLAKQLYLLYTGIHKVAWK
ncbi:hypothetical protein GPLA_0524 [Paraglaciecola polaris LMG 21857]|uniref:Uncharacterized protein n=1 Tax=Paraglaciecola polaris LMG 21857 TaxID=1129793 RepID=K6Z5G7_9ALTE|nr:hypothetical protein GPLA_0524 [Paraglaciecola polaris LMG 21857]